MKGEDEIINLMLFDSLFTCCPLNKQKIMHCCWTNFYYIDRLYVCYAQTGHLTLSKYSND